MGRAYSGTKYTLTGDSSIELDFGKLNPKQEEFWKSRALFTCYGGAKGGGKSHVLRLKAVDGCLKYPNIKILLLRRQYKDLWRNHIEPLQRFVPQKLGHYNDKTQTMYFFNGSTISFGHYNYDSSWDSYNGQEFDWIMIDEATQFTYQQFRSLGGCLRGVNKIPKRFYLTCNPGGVGHRWVKRLFIDKDFTTDADDPEENENPKDYKFIFARIEDNEAMKEQDPVGYQQYLFALKQMPEKVRDAYRYGLWDDLGGAYFDEFRSSKHVIEPIPLEKGWTKYRAFDYGLDCFACYWVAVDNEGHNIVYREFYKSNLIVPDAAHEILDNTFEEIRVTFAPPDMWMTQKTDGKTMAEGFFDAGVPIVKVPNNRVQGHMQIKQMLADGEDGKPKLVIFNTCKHLIEDLPAIQTDDNNPNDCAKQPHEVTHSVDGLRYYCISRTIPGGEPEKKTVYEEDEDETYENYMCGGEPTQNYIGA